jgi:cell division protein FtsI (penicillin-binding protein 3)
MSFPTRDDSRLDRQLLRRRQLAAGLILFACLGLAARLAVVQTLESGGYATSAGRQQTFVEPLAARPGEIVDRHGRVLATSVTTRSLWVNPRRMTESSAPVTARLARAVHLDANELAHRIERNPRREFLWVRRRLTPEEADAVRKLRLPAAMWGFRDEYIRRYPQGPAAAHVLGLRDVDGRGRGGIEQAFDRLLRGVPGRRVAVRDARGRIVQVLDDKACRPRNGRLVQLTLDVVLQLDAERELDALMREWKPASAGVVVMDPRNGDVLAMASRPAFDPNEPLNVPEAAWKNVNTASVFEPGSTFKPFVVAWALQKRVLARDEVLNCEHGQYRMGRRLLHDHHPYGNLSVKDVLVKSSNVGMAKIGERLTNRGLYSAAVRFGFGRKTGSGLPGEVAGILRPLKQWNGYSTGSVPMGQEIGVTPLQLITAHAALANGGRLISPRLVRRIGPSESRLPLRERAPVRGANGDIEAGTPPSIVSPTVDADVARWLVRDAMVDVVRRGTGKKAILPGYEVFGKTGTAQKIDVTTGGYSGKHHVCSFVCGAPADNPRVLVLVTVDSPTTPGVHYGGTVAAPTAARVLHRALVYLGVPVGVAAGKR